MNKVEVKQTIQVYEVDDEKVPIGKNVTLGIDSHWNWDERIVLRFGKSKLTVLGEDLKTAIDNAMNVR